ncbi:MAG: hypothetical protein WCY86_09885 [Spirosomataceae bacterium]
MKVEKKAKSLDELSTKVLEGVRKALRKLVESAAEKDEDLVVGDNAGNVHSLPAKELLKTLVK